MSDDRLTGRESAIVPVQRTRKVAKAAKSRSFSTGRNNPFKGDGDRIITRTVEKIEVIPKTKRSKADSEKVAKAAKALIVDLRKNRDSLPHGI